MVKKTQQRQVPYKYPYNSFIKPQQTNKPRINTGENCKIVILSSASNTRIDVFKEKSPLEFVRKQGIFFLVRDESLRIYDPLNLEALKSIRIHQPLNLETPKSVRI